MKPLLEIFNFQFKVLQQFQRWMRRMTKLIILKRERDGQNYQITISCIFLFFSFGHHVVTCEVSNHFPPTSDGNYDGETELIHLWKYKSFSDNFLSIGSKLMHLKVQVVKWYFSLLFNILTRHKEYAHHNHVISLPPPQCYQTTLSLVFLHSIQTVDKVKSWASV